MKRKRSPVRTAAARTSSSDGPRSPPSTPRRAPDNIFQGGAMQFDNFSFGSIQIDGSTYEHDVVIDRGEISKRKKKASKQFREEFGHTPLSVEENIPWKCRQLVIGSGAYGRLPVMQEVRRETERLKIKLLVLPTAEAIKVLEQDLKDTNAILHVTC